MTTTHQVTFCDQWRQVSIHTTGKPVLVPEGLIVTRSTDRVTELAPLPFAGSQSDVIAGNVPLICIDDGDYSLAWLEIQPPGSALTLEDLEKMWADIIALGVSPPSAISTQGRLVAGELSPARQLLLDFLHRASQAAIGLLKMWPSTFEQTIRWQHLELPGGKEDPALTMRNGFRFPGVQTGQKKIVPFKSARRISKPFPWTSMALSRASKQLAVLLCESNWLGIESEGQKIALPFTYLASQATPRKNNLDTPISTWPDNAKAAYEAISACLAIIKALNKSPDTEIIKAPLCFIWRLYEAWVASTIFHQIKTDKRFSCIIEPSKLKGCEWFAVFTDGKNSWYLVTQLRISAQLSSLKGKLPVSLQSITSDLVPDIILIDNKEPTAHVWIVDAKHRTGNFLDPRDISEDASKYVWGIRIKKPNHKRLDIVESVILASTATPQAMHSKLSRIDAIKILPTSTDHLMNFLSSIFCEN